MHKQIACLVDVTWNIMKTSSQVRLIEKVVILMSFVLVFKCETVETGIIYTSGPQTHEE